MAFKQFLQNLFERVGLAEPPAPPPQAADVPLADPRQLRPIFSRLAAWGVKQVHLIAGDEPEADDLVQAARQAVQLGMQRRRPRPGKRPGKRQAPLRSGRRRGPRDRNPFPLGNRRGPRRLGRGRRLSQRAAGDGHAWQTSSCRWPSRSSWCRPRGKRSSGHCNCSMIAACAKSASLPSPAATTSRRVGPSRPASWLPPPVGSSSQATSRFQLHLVSAAEIRSRRGPWPSRSVAARGRRRMPCGSSPTAA